MTNAKETKTLVWRQKAACRGVDPDIFYPVSDEEAEDAKAICRLCPVQQACLEWALVNRERDGVWGGRDRAGAPADHPPPPAFGLSASHHTDLLMDAAAGEPSALDALGGWPFVLGRLSSGADLDASQAGAALSEVLEGNATQAQIAAFVFGLRCKGETVEEMTGLVAAMLDAAERVSVPETLAVRLVDTCGTGGDRSGTINVSTIAALVVAGAGVPVCKHGGRAASSKAGSADVLEALGVVIDLGPAGVTRCIAEAGIGFCFAPRYHPAMRHAVPVRRELGVPTAFNFLGPLADPARVRRQVVGVGDPAMAEKMARVLVAGGATDVLVVHGADGLDELSTTGPSTMWQHRSRGRGGETTRVDVDPSDFDLAPAKLSDLLGGDATVNADFARRVLAGERGPHRDIVLLNAAAGLMVGGVAGDLAAGIELATSALDGGAASGCLDRLVDTSRSRLHVTCGTAALNGD